MVWYGNLVHRVFLVGKITEILHYENDIFYTESTTIKTE